VGVRGGLAHPGRGRGRLPHVFNIRARLKAATFLVAKTIEQFDAAASSIPPPRWSSLTSLEWIPARENLTLSALGHAAVEAGYKVKYAVAADLVETLY